MSRVRRAYIYLACIASLEAVVSAVISLLRSLLVSGGSTSRETVAVQIATVIVGLPVFLVHWLWAQRLAWRDAEERGATLRRVYLYGAMAVFLQPLVSGACELLDGLLRFLFRLPPNYRGLDLSPAALAVHDLVALVVLALVWAYHRRVAAADRKVIPEQGGAARVRRLYIYGFSAWGLAMAVPALVYLLRWLMTSIGAGAFITRQVPTAEVARLVVGLPLWLIFWSRAQRLFAGPDEEERAATLRKVYLYLAVFLGALGTVSTVTIILSSGLGRVLGASGPGGGGGGGDVRGALATILGAGLVWAYHGNVLHRDATTASEPAVAAWVGRLYRYLVATIGLGVFLVGLVRGITLLVRALLGVRFVAGLPQQAADCTALIVAGLLVWILPWRQLQGAATASGPEGAEETRSTIRKAYLYLFLFAATMGVLGGGVYLVTRLVSLAMGVRQAENLPADLGQAVAYTLIAVGVWLYHGSILYRDGRRAREVPAERLSSLRVAVLDPGDGLLGRALLDELRRELPGLSPEPLALTPEAAAALGTDVAADPTATLGQVDVIVGPWTIAVAGGAVSAGLAQAVVASPAWKVLIPSQGGGWYWVGAGELKTADAVRRVARAVRGFTADGGIT